MTSRGAEHVLVLDAGTSSVRCAIFGAGRQETIAIARRPWSYETSDALGAFGRSFDARAFWALRLCRS
jgi:sugar (pentulose or hexulose) kinase